jgi:hypothetical protein
VLGDFGSGSGMRAAGAAGLLEVLGALPASGAAGVRGAVSGKRGEVVGAAGADGALGAASGSRPCAGAGEPVEGPAPAWGGRAAGCGAPGTEPPAGLEIASGGTPPELAPGAVVSRGLETGVTVAGDAGRDALDDPELGVAGVAGVPGPADVRGGGSPDPPDAGTAGLDGAREGAKGAAGTPVRGHDGIVPVGIRSGRRGTAPGEPLLASIGGCPVEVAGRAPALPGGAGAPEGGTGRGMLPAPVAPGAGPGTGVRTGGLESNAGPGRGMGVSIGIGAIGPGAPGGSSLNGSGVNLGGGAAGGPRRSSGSSRLRISGGGRSGTMPGSQAVQSPCGGNSAPHLRHLDTAA